MTLVTVFPQWQSKSNAAACEFCWPSYALQRERVRTVADV